MFKNPKTGEVITNEQLDDVVQSWLDSGYIGRPRENIIAALEEQGFELIDDVTQ